jgi:ribose transport system permease protein
MSTMPIEQNRGQEPLPSVPGPPDAGVPRGRRSILWYLEAGAVPLLTLLLIVLFSVLPETRDTFPTVANLKIMLGGQAVLVVVSMAVLIPLMCNRYDFSVGACAGLGGIFAATVMASSGSVWLGILAALATGLVVGVVNGLLVTVARVDSVVVTLATTSLISGVVTWKTDGKSIVSGIPDSLTSFVSGTLLGVPRGFWVSVAVVLAALYLTRQTPFGRRMDAIGTNPAAAGLLGLRVNRIILTTFLISAAVAGLAGMLVIGQSGTASPTVGPGLTIPAIAAAFLSVAAISPGRFNVLGTFAAIIFLAVLNSGLNLAGADTYVNDFANGGALIVGVALASFLGRRRTSGAG